MTWEDSLEEDIKKWKCRCGKAAHYKKDNKYYCDKHWNFGQPANKGEENGTNTTRS